MSPKTKRRSRQGLASRQKIIDATFEIAAELGYRGTSIEKVSKRAGLPASSVYWHFANKDELFAEVIQHSFNEWNASFPDPEPPADQSERHGILVANFRDVAVSIAASPEFWRLGLMLTLERNDIETTARRRFLVIRRKVLDRIADFWQIALPPSDSQAQPQLPRLMAQFTMAVTDGLFIATQAEDDTDPAVLAEMLADALEALAVKHASVS